MHQGGLVPEFQHIAKQLIRISKSLEQLYQDQMDILADINAQNMFKIDQEQHAISIAHDLFLIRFETPQPKCTAQAAPLIRYQFNYQAFKNEAIQDFILQDLYFLTGDQKPQNALWLRDAAKQLRELLIQHCYLWVNGPVRVRQFLQQISLIQAEIIDQLMIKHRHYLQPVLTQAVRLHKPMPEDVVHLFTQMFNLETLCAEHILPLQNIIESLDGFCFSAPQFLNRPLYRITEVTFLERFNLKEWIEHEADFARLYRHAEERPALLGFSRLIERERWQNDDIFAKHNFLSNEANIWHKKISRLPVFDYSRVVNWIFKQSAEVLDWLSHNIQHSSVRVAVTALSFVDVSRIHPQVILATLQYFQYSCARMFIHSCSYYASQEGWFEHPANQAVVLKEQEQTDDQRTAISASILYLDEWTSLMRCVLGKNDAAVKRVYADLSRVMQAFMLHLDQVCHDLPNDVLPYIRLETQQNKGFLAALRRHHIQLNEFRQRFYLQDRYVRESLFDSYVRDYLADYFAQNKAVPKNVTWSGLFSQAISWHDQLQKQEIMTKLRKNLGLAEWKRLTAKKQYHYQGWQFSELCNLDEIIHESKTLRHCLAASYALRIVEGDYVAFHMHYPEQELHLTLGCHVQSGQLMVDQLEFANNQKAGVEQMHVAVQFIQLLNQELDRSLYKSEAPEDNSRREEE